jgi:hypothetical protein
MFARLSDPVPLRKISRLWLCAISLCLMSGCTTTLVQPYDDKLFDDTEAVYRKISAVVLEGLLVSPLRDDERQRIASPEKHPGHYLKFEDKYEDLIIETDLLIIRAAANYQAVDAAGVAAQERLGGLIEEKIKTQCPEMQDKFKSVGLTAGNYLDLQCVILSWRTQHRNPEVTQGTGILKRANWEARSNGVFDIVLAIQKSESFKKKP